MLKNIRDILLAISGFALVLIPIVMIIWKIIVKIICIFNHDFEIKVKQKKEKRKNIYITIFGIILAAGYIIPVMMIIVMVVKSIIQNGLLFTISGLIQAGLELIIFGIVAILLVPVAFAQFGSFLSDLFKF